MLNSTEKFKVWIRQSIESFSIIKETLNILGIHMIFKHYVEENSLYHTTVGKYYVQNH
jgi:hypothetical protein